MKLIFMKIRISKSEIRSQEGRPPRVQRLQRKQCGQAGRPYKLHASTVLIFT